MRASPRSYPLLIGVMSLSLAVIPSACSDDDNNSNDNPERESTPLPQPTETVTLTGIQSGIETVGMDSGFLLNGDGFLYTTTEPVLLFRDGTACRDIDYLVSGLNLTTHKTQFPEAWTVWRREAGRIQIQVDGQWRNLGYSSEYRPLPKGTLLKEKYTSTQAGRKIAFLEDGRFVSGALIDERNDAQGSYAIEGYLITLSYDSGVRETYPFVFDPATPGILWLSENAYLVEDPND